MWVALALLASLAGPATADTEALVVGAPARAFDLAALNPEIATALVRESRVALHDLVGLRPTHPMRGVVVVFFDRGSSALGLPALEVLAHRYKGEKIRFLGICVDDSDTVGDWILAQNLSFPVLADPHRVVAGRYEVRTLPFVVLVDARARVFAAGGPDALDLEGPLDLEITNLLELGPPIGP
jgi:peroxiredoxin